MKKLGYKYSIGRKIISFFTKFLIKILFLDRDTVFANQLSSNLKLKKKINFLGKQLIFITGNNRLKWRVDSFYDEEPLIIDWLMEMSKDDIFFDVGANVGTYTLPALSRGAYVIGSELDILNIEILYKNIFENKFQEKFLLLPFGLADTNRISKVFYRDFTHGDALQSLDKISKIPHLKFNPSTNKQVVFSADFLFKEFKIPQPNKIKIDVDGNELLVFQGMKKLLSEAQEIYIEDNGFKENEIIFKFLEENKFKKINEEKSVRSAIGLDMKNILYKKN